MSPRESTPIAEWSCFLSADPGKIFVPEPPRAAFAVFGSALPTARRYAELLAGPGVERGLLGPGEAPRIWDRHLLNSAVVAELVPGHVRAEDPDAAASATPSVLVDVGSGAGLPGLVLAIMLPMMTVVLVEPMERRTAFLGECIDELGLRNVEVMRGRAEDVAGAVAGDVVTARAVARLDRLAILAAGVAKPGGLVLAIKGATAQQEVDEAGPVLRRLGVGRVEVVRAGVGVIDPPAAVVRFVTRTPPQTATADAKRTEQRLTRHPRRRSSA